MVREGNRQLGMSLIELMVTLAIVVILAAVSIPLTRGWVVSAHLNQARDVLIEGYATARALALQNPTTATGTMAAATLTVNNNTLTVSHTLDTTTTTIWSGSVNGDIAINLTDAGCNNTLAFTNNGLPLNTACLDYSLLIAGNIAETDSLE